MTSVVVDTDVVSFIFKSHPIGALYEAVLAGCTVLISFMTLAELDQWGIQSKWGPSRGVAWGPEWPVVAQTRGRRIECADAWIAAAAPRHDVPIGTHNRADYLGVPVGL